MRVTNGCVNGEPFGTEVGWKMFLSLSLSSLDRVRRGCMNTRVPHPIIGGGPVPLELPMPGSQYTLNGLCTIKTRRGFRDGFRDRLRNPETRENFRKKRAVNAVRLGKRRNRSA
jgi:hypothetical protein